MFLCSPNNPTGNELEIFLEFFIENFSGIVVLDEAYIEFSSRKSAISWLAEISRNLIGIANPFKSLWNGRFESWNWRKSLLKSLL